MSDKQTCAKHGDFSEGSEQKQKRMSYEEHALQIEQKFASDTEPLMHDAKRQKTNVTLENEEANTEQIDDLDKKQPADLKQEHEELKAKHFALVQKFDNLGKELKDILDKSMKFWETNKQDENSEDSSKQMDDVDQKSANVKEFINKMKKSAFVINKRCDIFNIMCNDTSPEPLNPVVELKKFDIKLFVDCMKKQAKLINKECKLFETNYDSDDAEDSDETNSDSNNNDD